MIGRGINAHLPSAADISLAAACGCKWIRLDFDWRAIEPKKGQFNWAPYDAAVRAARANGMKVYATLAYVPTWVNADYRACPDTFNWAYFCTKVGVRYNGQINVFSLGNEPNLKDFYTGSQKDYVNVILKAGYHALKSVSGNIVIAGGDLSTASKSNWWSWFSLLKKNSQYYDVFAWHVYQKTADKVLSRYSRGRFPIVGWLVPKWRPFKWMLDGIKKKGKAVFLTETGLKARTSSKKELDNQKEFVSKLEKIRKDTKSDAIFIYDLKDNSLFKEKWGVFDERGNPKKSAQWLMNNR